jgi:hypothetical protein
LSDMPLVGPQPEMAEAGGAPARARRHARMLLVDIVDSRGALHRLRIRNLSKTGLGGVLEVDLDHGENVSVHLPNSAPVTGTIVWRSGKAHGIHFQTVVDVDVVLAPKLPAEKFAPRALHVISNSTYRPGITKLNI